MFSQTKNLFHFIIISFEYLYTFINSQMNRDQSFSGKVNNLHKNKTQGTLVIIMIYWIEWNVHFRVKKNDTKGHDWNVRGCCHNEVYSTGFYKRNYSWCSLTNKVDPTVLSTYRKKKYVLIVLSRPYLHNLSQNYPFNAKIIFCRKTWCLSRDLICKSHLNVCKWYHILFYI